MSDKSSSRRLDYLKSTPQADAWVQGFTREGLSAHSDKQFGKVSWGREGGSPAGICGRATATGTWASPPRSSGTPCERSSELTYPGGREAGALILQPPFVTSSWIFLTSAHPTCPTPWLPRKSPRQSPGCCSWTGQVSRQNQVCQQVMAGRRPPLSWEEETSSLGIDDCAF